MTTPIPAQPSRQTETRHHPKGKTCHHFVFHHMTCDEFDALRARAAGRCELCGIAEEDSGGRRLVIDHFEGPGVALTRGLICDRCNSTMTCLDENKPWGSKRTWETAARAYEARSWRHLPPERLALVEAIRMKRRAHREKLLSRNAELARVRRQPKRKAELIPKAAIGLDADGLAEFIGRLEAQCEALRELHARLVESEGRRSA